MMDVYKKIIDKNIIFHNNLSFTLNYLALFRKL